MLTAQQFAESVAEAAPARRHLRAVVHEANKDKIRRRNRIVAIALGGLVAIGALQLTLNLAIVQGAYELDALETQSSQLAKEIEATEDDLTVVSSSQSLAAKASELGMVPTPVAAYIDMSTGSLSGVPTPASEDGELTDGYVPNQLLEQGESNIEIAEPVSPVPLPAKPTAVTPPPAKGSTPPPAASLPTPQTR
ncbi:hypothetical protein ACFVAJ_16750 [Agromyces sp. NPDC057679]|uniref:hypothetical protein n=1 Tax=Agromyces sp. NPDC057679 TaxID=3346207 RepID=UPI003672F765